MKRVDVVAKAEIKKPRVNQKWILAELTKN